MRIAFFTALIVLPASAWAHTGHIAESNGHDHWLVAGAFAAAAVFSLGRALVARIRA